MPRGTRFLSQTTVHSPNSSTLTMLTSILRNAGQYDVTQGPEKKHGVLYKELVEKDKYCQRDLRIQPQNEIVEDLCQ